jgi:hypothetical protein
VCLFLVPRLINDLKKASLVRHAYSDNNLTSLSMIMNHPLIFAISIIDGTGWNSKPLNHFNTMSSLMMIQQSCIDGSKKR